MEYIFEIIDKSGRKIRLTKKQWSHIGKEHPDVHDIEEIKQTLLNPIKTSAHEYGNIYDFYSYFKSRQFMSKYFKVVVKYLNGNGFVITAYFVKRIN